MFDAHPALAEFAAAQRDKAAAAMERLTSDSATPPARMLEVAGDMLHGLGWALFAWARARQARASLATTDTHPHVTRLDSARYGVQWLLANALPSWQRETSLLFVSWP